MTATDFNQLQMAFASAAHRSGSEREDYIRQLTRQDPGLANEVATLLAFEGDSNDPLEEACQLRWRSLSAHSPSPTVHGYTVQRRIGVGGQAEVFLARQDSTGQDVAIKVFLGSGLVDSQRHRIDAETKALVRLQLPNVVAILDRGQTACGREYLVTRFVAGRRIDEAAAQLLPEKPQAIADLFAKIAETLARVHRHGIIHRDLKPSNILVDDEGEPYVLDFGLASFFADPSGRLLTVTQEEAFQGSILWASPEQVDASFGGIDQRSDIYSLGVVLYQAITGRFPYPVEGGIFDVAQQIVRTAPARLTPLSETKALGAPQWETVVLRALDKQPSGRFQSADEFATALRNLPKLVDCGHPPIQNAARRKTWSRVGLVGSAVVSCGVLWLGMNPLTAKSGDSRQALSSSAQQDSSIAVVSPMESIDDELTSFGTVPMRWRQVGLLQTTRHEIERANVSIEGNFELRLTVSADRKSRAGLSLTLAGASDGDDLTITAQKVNTWSDNESWEFRTPAGTVLKGLPIGTHTFLLKRHRELLTLAADAVHLPDRSDTNIATFAATGTKQFEAIRLVSSGPAMKLENLRLTTTADHSP